VLLGDDAFVARHQQDQSTARLREVSKAQRRSVALELRAYGAVYPDRAEAMARAYLSGAHSMAEIGAYFGVHYMTVSRAVKRFEQSAGSGTERQDDWEMLDCKRVPQKYYA